MVSSRKPRPRVRSGRGASMIEVLVTLVIIALGLLGMVGLQAKLQSTEMESYQRTQALLLLDDLRGRIEANRLEVANYADYAPVGTPLGAGMVCPDATPASTRVLRDVRQWCLALQGASETVGGASVGAMVGGRGCVESLGVGPTGDQTVRVSVAWQGLTPIAAPAETCAAGLYNGAAGTPCQGDLCRRVVSTVIRIANLK
ncbi:pilus assembly protein [Ramlibacter henchirensis]|uniref:Pilus assembly protein n=1 Tax=Ramlibacter henchirensis TaxID=204072 RepID=A0A4Z0BVR4_9BURK|nr:pilus assembly protein [Ramlibacter henchirensis]TFZ02135.1 pilus assembly protein [Ramlibacter henchirensis]